ncbi:MAG: PQQ-binding-like beta-propeller repeat protein [Verrucomicrobiales bacterium]
MRISSPPAFLVVLTALFAKADCLSAADWPNWRGPGHDGVSKEAIPSELPAELPVLWKARVGTGFSTVSVQGTRVLTMGNRDDVDIVSCLDADTGELFWEHTYPCELDPLYYEGGPGSTPTIHGNSVYTLSKKGHAFRLDLEDGKVLWQRDLVADHDFALPEWSFACSPFVDRDRLLLNVGRGGLALSRETGETLWMNDTDTSGYATPVPFSHWKSGTTHLLFSAKSLLGLDSDTGAIAWEFPSRSSRDVNAADPVVAGDGFVLSSTAGTTLLSLGEDESEPLKVWEQRDLKWYFNSGVLVDGHLYSLNGTTHRPTELACHSVETGELIWSEEGFGSGGLMAAGKVVILFDLGVLTLFEATPAGFKPLHRQKILDGKCWTSPVLSHGRIYCRNAEGELVCVSLLSDSGE